MPELENSPLEQQEIITPPQAEISFFAKLKTKWPVVLGALGSIVLFAALIYAAYSYSRRGQEVQPTPSLMPTLAVTPLVTSTLIPSATGGLSPTPAVSAEGKIAFVRDGNLWTIFSNGTGEMQLTEAKTIHGTGAPNPDYVEIPGDVENPNWSSDGSSIVFNDTNGNIWVATGYTAKKLITSPFEQQGATTYSAPQWSPDGQKIACLVIGDQYSGLTVFDKEGKLLYEFLPSDFLVTRDSRFVSQVYAVAAPGLLVDSFVWMKDSKSLIVGVKGNPMDEIRKNVQEIWQVNYEGMKKRLLEVGSQSILSPDGTKIAYTKDGEIWTVDATGLNNKQITFTSATAKEIFGTGVRSNPKWSLDGQQIVFTEIGVDYVGLGVVNADGLNLRGVERNNISPKIESAGLHYREIINSCWVSSDQVVIEAKGGVPEGSDLYSISVADGVYQILTTNASQPAWSPR